MPQFMTPSSREYDDLLKHRNAIQIQRDVLRNALVGLVGVDGEEDLKAMTLAMIALPMSGEDKVATVTAIQALLMTLEAA